MRVLLGFLVRRLGSTIPLLLFLPFLTLLLMHLVPGNYFDALRLNPQISAATIAQYEKLYHLDQPLLVQYGHWLIKLLRLDFGYSFAYKQPVLDILGSHLGNTLLLSSVSVALAWMIAIPLGLWAGTRRGGLLDRFWGGVAYAGLAIPNFYLCLLFLFVASVTGILPLGGITSVHHEELSLPMRVLDVMRHMVIPVSVLALGSACVLFRLMRAQTTEVKQREFVLFLRSCRLPESTIRSRHIFRNAVNPLISLFGMELPALFSGAALVEIFTGWPGLGRVMLQAVMTQDVFLVLGNMMMIAFLLILGNCLADVLLVISDPRIRTGAHAS